MRLLHCQLQNVRQHGDLAVTFAPGLTLIGGPNESGKSTLVEALHRALFLKAAATGAPVEALQSRLHLGHPTVALAFEAQGDTWSLRKRFSGASGQVSLKAERSGSQFSGPAAEEVLAGLLGVGDIVGSRQAGTVLPSRWAHLWVRQGAAGDDLLTAGKGSYDFDRLRLQLERSGGAAVQQSAHDQLVEQRITAALEENFTSKGTRKHSPLYQREEELKAARQRLTEALARLADYEAAGEELAAIGVQLEQLQQVDLPALEQRQALLLQGAEAAARLDAAIALASKELEPIRLRHDAAVAVFQQCDGLSGEIRQRQQRLLQLQANADQAQGREAELAAALRQRGASLELLRQQRHTLEQRQLLLQRLVERTSTAQSLQRLASELETLRQLAGQRQALARQLAALPNLSKPVLQQLRQLEQQLRDARTRQQALATGVRLLRADQPVQLDGQPLQAGDERRLSSPFQLQVGDGVVLEIAPGGDQAQGDLERAVTSAGDQLTARLAACGATSVEAAADLLEQRTALEQQLAALANGAPAEPAGLERQHNGLLQRLTQLDAELQELATVRHALEQEQPLPQALAELQALEQQLGRTARRIGPALQAAERDLEAARLALGQFQQQRLSEVGQLEGLRAELADRRQRLDQLVGEHGDRQAQAARLQGLAGERQQADTQLARLQADRSALGSQDAAREQRRLQEQIEQLQRQQEHLLDRRGAAKQRCDAISAQDPFAAVEQARLQLETAEADHRQLRRLTEAHQLLQELFQHAQADLSSRYSQPLARAIDSYLSPLVSDGPAARLSYDQNQGFQGLQFRRGQELYDFGSLSGGMREQLAAALRLSMADVLKDAHDGCLPLVFDDAFTNSDPDRIDLVKRMLTAAVARGLQVILLTCDPAAYGSCADQVVSLDPAWPNPVTRNRV